MCKVLSVKEGESGDPARMEWICIVLAYNVKHNYVTQDTSLQAASSPGSPSSTLSV